MLSETELDPYFDAIRREAFRLEALPAYAMQVESAGLHAYLAGEPFQKSEAGQAFNEYVERGERLSPVPQSDRAGGRRRTARDQVRSAWRQR